MALTAALALALILGQVHSLTYDHVQDLTWNISNANGSISVDAQPPQGVYSSLLAGGVLNNGDFYYRYNDMDYRWVSYDNWTFSTEITASPEVLAEEKVVLEFEGLDTAAHIRIGDHEIAFTDNMFVRSLIDVKEAFAESATQEVSITFESPVNYAESVFNEMLAKDGYPILPECVDANFKGECHPNVVRKMQASFSWDWGPAFPDSGIWKSWNLVGWSTAKIHDILFEAKTSAALPNIPDPTLQPEWTVTVQVWLDSAVTTGVLNGEIAVELGGVEYVKDEHSFDLDEITFDQDFQAFSVETAFTIPEDTVELWWPNGYGDQSLYDLKVTWTSQHAEVSNKTVRVGFRTIELDQSIVNEAVPENGRNFFFRINNVEIFMKGSNWIPAHVLPDRVTPEYTRQLLEDAADTHQNCMRVWGGGIYETDVFYEVADELGILIWQDMMFACSMYSGEDEFLNSVGKELKTQVRRLQHHASIMLWAGNNENELALRDNWYGTVSHFAQYKEDYIKLYVDTVRNVTTALDTSRPFLVSSPSNGIQSEQDGYVAQNPADVRFGDVHHYDYVSNGWQWQNFQNARFTSEYGFQSWPSLRTLSQALDAEDIDIKSPLMQHRQHHPLGQMELDLQIGVHMKYNRTETSLEHYLYMTQINQAMSMKTETEHFRRMRNTLDANDRGNSMGALYWQLNDIWQGASWSSIEYGGRWKMLHYYVKNFFAPVIVSPWIDDQTMNINIVSDLVSDLTAVRLAVRLYSYQSFYPILSKFMRVDATHLRSETVASFHLEDDFQLSEHCGSEYPKDNCFFVYSLTDSVTGTVAPSNFLLLGEPKNAPLQPATITVTSVTQQWLNRFYIIVTSDHIAMFVWFEIDIPGVFSDNGIHMAEANVGVHFYAREKTSAYEICNSLQITSLTDTTDHIKTRVTGVKKLRCAFA